MRTTQKNAGECGVWFLFIKQYMTTDQHVPKLPPRPSVPRMMHTRGKAVELRTTAQRILFPLRQAAVSRWVNAVDGNQALASWAQSKEREQRDVLINHWLYYKYDIETLKEYYINYLSNIQRIIEKNL